MEGDGGMTFYIRNEEACNWVFSMLYHKHNKLCRYDYIEEASSYEHRIHTRNFIDTHAQVTHRRDPFFFFSQNFYYTENQ